MSTLAVIRVFTTDDATVRQSHGAVIAAKYKIAVRTYCIENQTRGIHDEATEREAAPKIVQAALQAVREGAACILVSCAADPAVAECRAAVRVPVLGAGSCAAAVALALGGRVGVLNLAGPTPPRVAAVLGRRLAAEAAPAGVADTTDLLAPRGRRAAAAAARTLAARADVLLFGCTGFTTIGLKKELEIGLPVVDAVEAAGAVAAMYCANT